MLALPPQRCRNSIHLRTLGLEWPPSSQNNAVALDVSSTVRVGKMIAIVLAVSLVCSLIDTCPTLVMQNKRLAQDDFVELADGRWWCAPCGIPISDRHNLAAHLLVWSHIKHVDQVARGKRRCITPPLVTVSDDDDTEECDTKNPKSPSAEGIAGSSERRSTPPQNDCLPENDHGQSGEMENCGRLFAPPESLLPPLPSTTGVSAAVAASLTPERYVQPDQSPEFLFYDSCEAICETPVWPWTGRLVCCYAE